MNNSVHESGSGRAALKLRGVPVVKSVKLDEAAKTLQTPKQSDVQVMMGGSNDLVNVLSGPEPAEAKRAPDSPAGEMYVPNFRKL